MKVNWTDNFEELYRVRGQQRYGVRLLALWKIQSGLTEEAVCGFLQKTHRTIRTWRQLYEKEGVSGLLQMKPGRGGKWKLKPEDVGRFREVLDLRSKSLKGGRLRGIDIQEILRNEFKAEYGLSGVYELLKRLGYSWITCRSIHPKANKELQDSFKKGVPRKGKRGSSSERFTGPSRGLVSR
jgi:transposase